MPEKIEYVWSKRNKRLRVKNEVIYVREIGRYTWAASFEHRFVKFVTAETPDLAVRKLRRMEETRKNKQTKKGSTHA